MSFGSLHEYRYVREVVGGEAALGSATPTGQEFVLVDKLRGNHHDLVCGQVKTDAEGSSFDTARSQGARVGLAGRVETFDEARAVVESDCGGR